MKFLRFYIIYRIQITIGLIALGIFFHMEVDTVLAWLCYIAAFISLLLYFMMGSMRLVQEAVTEGDVDGAMKYMKLIKFPKLLFKPIRMGYYMLQSNLALATDNLDEAESNIRKSLKTNSTLVGDVRGSNLLQLGFVQLKKGNTKEARKYLLEAIQVGLPDKENLAAAHLQLCSIEMQRNNNRVAKDHYRKAKAAKPKSEELVKQIAMLDKQMPRIPG